jgi:hypothetical protein
VESLKKSNQVRVLAIACLNLKLKSAYSDRGPLENLKTVRGPQNQLLVQAKFNIKVISVLITITNY